MKRVQYHRYGGPEEMRLESYELPALGADEILVRVKAASVNPFDWKVRQGVMKFMTGNRFPRGMGSDFAGVVEQVGGKVTRVRVGDEVIGTTPMKTGGAFAETLVTKESLAVKKPASLPFEAAAALPIIGVTAWRALILQARLKPGQSVFVNGALGGVGQAAINVAHAHGARVAGRVGPRALDEAKARGVDPALDYTQGIPAELNKKFEVVLDAAGSLAPREGDRLVKKGGLVIDTNPTPEKFLRTLFSRRRQVVFGTPHAEALDRVAELAAAGKFPITLAHKVGLDESIDLIRDLEAGRAKGKAVILIA